jgi:hypothetical protein
LSFVALKRNGTLLLAVFYLRTRQALEIPERQTGIEKTEQHFVPEVAFAS